MSAGKSFLASKTSQKKDDSFFWEKYLSREFLSDVWMLEGDEGDEGDGGVRGGVRDGACDAGLFDVVSLTPLVAVGSSLNPG